MIKIIGGSHVSRYHRRLAGESASTLAGVIGRLIPKDGMIRLRTGTKRRRVFTPVVTFWNFLAQTLSPGQACRETVQRVQAARGRRGQSTISSATGAYCRARHKLPIPVLASLWSSMASALDNRMPTTRLWLGLRVAVLDGSTLSMPDTPENQAEWPQSSTQKPGCGFPVMRLLAVFSLASGALHAIAIGSLHNAEHALLQNPSVKTALAQFDVALGDRIFGSFVTFWQLISNGRHGVFRMHQGRIIDWRKGKCLGPNDRVMTWIKPLKHSWAGLNPLPEFITVRVLRFTIAAPGFRTRVVVLVTDLLDPIRYPAHALAELYLERWRVELFLRDIKITLGMDILRCLTPPMILRELHMHLIAYNAIRSLMAEAADRAPTPLDRISFKGTCDAIRQWAPDLAATALAAPSRYAKLLCLFFRTIAGSRVPWRPDRSEPRAVKRRPKNYHLLTKPRHLMGNLPHRNRLH